MLEIAGLCLALFALSPLAVLQVVEVLHHSELFAEWQGWAEVSDAFFARVFVCPWCLSVWVGMAFGGLGILALIFAVLGCPLGVVLCLAPSLLFAFSRAANIINDVGRGYNRTPKRQNLISREHFDVTSGQFPSDPGDSPTSSFTIDTSSTGKRARRPIFPRAYRPEADVLPNGSSDDRGGSQKDPG